MATNRQACGVGANRAGGRIVTVETRHTPGPWTVIPDGGGAHVKTANGGYIAAVQWRDNARLIAAAPALLDALTELVDEVHALYQAGRVPAETWLRARAAIAQARGEA